LLWQPVCFLGRQFSGWKKNKQKNIKTTKPN